MSQETFPEQLKTTPRKWSPKLNGPDYGMPTTCIVFNSNDNYCQVLSIDALPRIYGNDVTIVALKGSFEALEATKKNTCKKLGEANVQALNLWLLNGDPKQTKLLESLDKIVTTSTNPADVAEAEKNKKRVAALATLTQGLGLLPKNILLQLRAHVLEDVLNDAPKKAVNKTKTDNLKNNGGWFEHERTIQAYYSAYHTLGNNLFTDPNSILMDELGPSPVKDAKGNDKYFINLEDQGTSVDVYATDMGVAKNGDPTNVSCRRNSDGVPLKTNGNPFTPDELLDYGCAPCMTNFVFGKGNENPLIPFQLPVGVQKDPDLLTYYAIRLTAKTKLMFSNLLLGNGGELTLEALSAAQPFGSRIGPYSSAFKLNSTTPETLFSSPYTLNAPGSLCNPSGGLTAGFKCSGRIPNLQVKSDNNDEIENINIEKKGWNLQDVQYQYLQGGVGVPNPNGPGFILPNPLTAAALEKAYQVAMSPTPSERLQYSIPNDRENINEEPFLVHFDSNKAQYSIYAPLTLPSKSGSTPDETVKKLIQQIQDTMSNPVNAQVISHSMKKTLEATAEALKDGLSYYLSTMIPNGQGENEEGLNIYRFNDPTRTTTGPGQGPLKKIDSITDEKLFVGKSEKLRTSWGNVMSQSVAKSGRNTYSVKFIPLAMVTEGSGVSTPPSNNSPGVTTTFKNKLTTSTLGVDDIGKLDH